jgi:large subunit ribosomal protein L10
VPLNLDQKKAVVADVAAVAARAPVMVAAEYSGITVAEMTRLRREARQAQVYLRVVKNNLLRRAVAGTGFECAQEGLRGPLVVAFSGPEPNSAARIVREFRKATPKLEVRIVAVSGQLLAPGDLERVASLPTRDQALATLMGTMKAPIAKLVRTLAAPHTKLLMTLAALRDQRRSAEG